MKRKLTAALIAALPALALGQNVVVFGDSLSDTGQPGWALKASYLDANGQMHKLYDEHVAAALGSSLTASGSGGSNYAYSGGVVLGSNSALTAAQPNLALQQQIANYTAQGVRPESLHILWGGGLAEALKQRGRVDHIGHVGYHRQIHAGAAQRLPLAGAFGSGGGGVGAHRCGGRGSTLGALENGGHIVAAAP